jgi:ankyrin repeat protein
MRSGRILSFIFFGAISILVSVFLTRTGWVLWRIAFGATSIAQVVESDSQEVNEYFDAIKTGDLAKVKEMPAKNPNLLYAVDYIKLRSGKSGGRGPALDFAVRCGHAHIVELLLSKGADPNQIRGAGGPDVCTPLYLAAFEGQADIVELLIRYGADVNSHIPGLQNPPLYYAINKQTAEALIASGADVKWIDARLSTPLHSTAERRGAEHGRIDVAELLLDHGADINAQDADGRTPLHEAARWGQMEMVQFLAENGAMINAKDRQGLTPLGLATEVAGSDLKARERLAQWLVSKGAEYTIWDVAWLGDVQRVREMLETDPTLANSTNSACKEPPIFKAISKGHADVVRLLLANGANCHAKGRYGEPALHAAAEKGQSAIVQILLEHGADINQKGANGELALHWAAARGYADVVQTLLAAGSEPNAKAEKPRVAMDITVHKDFDLVTARLRELATIVEVRQALRAGTDQVQTMAPVSLAFAAGDTALHSAAQKGHIKVLQLLLASGADVNITNQCRQTPLHYVSVFGNEDIVQVLVEAGGDMTAKDENGRTPDSLLPSAREVGVKDLSELYEKNVKTNR